jgi:hypothetical protein
MVPDVMFLKGFCRLVEKVTFWTKVVLTDVMVLELFLRVEKQVTV